MLMVVSSLLAAFTADAQVKTTKNPSASHSRDGASQSNQYRLCSFSPYNPMRNSDWLQRQRRRPCNGSLGVVLPRPDLGLSKTRWFSILGCPGILV
jgi:hypothetical protein